MGKKNKKNKAKGHPWRDNIEAVTVSIITIVLFKYFILEAYKIPTGSMQPTLMGNTETGVFDRVLVDKFSYHYRDPERFEIVVFRYPLDRSKNFIKRIVGMPNEELEIRNGDVRVRPDGESEWRVLRRPDPIYDATLKKLKTEGQWQLDGAGWSVDNGDIVATGAGSAKFPRSGSIKDNYTDGYPGKIASKINTGGKLSGGNDVGDLRVQGEISAAASCTEVQIELTEAETRYVVTIPGPAAADHAAPRIQEQNTGETQGDPATGEVMKLPAGKSISYRVQNLDDLVSVYLEGELVVSLEVKEASMQKSSVVLRTVGGGAEFSGTEVFRDIYYIAAGQKYPSFTGEKKIPEGHYLMLGDNTQDSSDSRDWQLTGFQIIEGDETGMKVLGNNRRQENPRIVPGGEAGNQVFFYDELGERHVFNQRSGQLLPPKQASFVPRELIRGRAVVVVWPIVPSLSVYRLKWVR
ncbi:MAG: signal peptidase I [bacterium]|nr:signal peptidase I [bacterium]